MKDNKRIAKNTFFLYILTFSNYFLGLLLYPFLSRVLSVSKFGLIGFSMSFVLIFQMIVEYGFSISATAEISQNRTDQIKINQTVSTVTWTKGLLSILSIGIFLVISTFIDMLQENFFIVFLFLIDGIIKAFLPDFYFRGIEEMKTITFRAVIAKSISILLVLFLVRGDAQVILIPVSYIIGDLIALIVTFGMMIFKGVKLELPIFKEIIIMLKDGFLFFISRLAVSINNSIGTFFLGLKFSPASIESGILAGITKITTAGEMMLTPIGDSIYPHMIKKKDYKLLKKVFIFGGIFWFIGCLFIFIEADLVCRILLGAKYSHVGNYLRILLVNAFFAFFSVFLGYPALSPIGKANYANIAIPIATLINIIVCSFLWFFDKVNLVNILLVMSTMNIILIIVRGSALFKFRYLIPKKNNSN